jgi:hypothetical protein
MNARQQELCSGILFIVLGVGTFLLSQEYTMWVGRRVGSGLFPAGLGVILAGLGVIVFVQSFRAAGEGSGPWVLRPIVAICLSILSFALLIERVGLLIALAVATVIAGFADKPNPKYLAIVYVVIVAFVYLFLMEVIKLPYRLYISPF